MCFIKEWEVDDVENPLYQTTISVAKDMFTRSGIRVQAPQDDKTGCLATSAISTCAKINIHNWVVTEALKQSAYKERMCVNDIADTGLFPSDAVVITDPYSFYKSAYLKSLPDERVWVSMDVRLNGLVLAFQLKDFSCIVKYSVTKIPPSRDHKLACQVKSRPNLDHHRCWVYQLPTQTL